MQQQTVCRLFKIKSANVYILSRPFHNKQHYTVSLLLFVIHIRHTIFHVWSFISQFYSFIYLFILVTIKSLASEIRTFLNPKK